MLNDVKSNLVLPAITPFVSARGSDNWHFDTPLYHTVFCFRFRELKISSMTETGEVLYL